MLEYVAPIDHFRETANWINEGHHKIATLERQVQGLLNHVAELETRLARAERLLKGFQVIAIREGENERE